MEHALAARDRENYLTNPVNVYRLMKRLHTDWEQLESRAQQLNNQIRRVFTEIYDSKRCKLKFNLHFTGFNISQHHYELNFPSQEDVDGAALALVRLQSTYKLDVAQVAAGILNGVKYG